MRKGLYSGDFSFLPMPPASSIKDQSKLLVREPNSENCLDLIFAAPPCEKVIIVKDTNYITSAIRKFRLDMPSLGSFQNIVLFNMSTTGLRACETMLFELGKN